MWKLLWGSPQEMGRCSEERAEPTAAPTHHNMWQGAVGAASWGRGRPGTGVLGITYKPRGVMG
jgi:hypothetical protein